MPEKGLTTFSPAVTSPSAAKQPRPTSNDDISPSNPSPGHAKAGVKRARDGSPKPPSNSRLDQDDTTDSKTKSNFKKQKTQSSTGVTALEKSSLGEQGAGLKISNGYSRKTDGATNGASKGQKKLSQKPNPKWSASAKKDLEKARQELPIWSKKADIRWALKNNDVLLLNGETGSGKSTQTPQFLCNEPWCKKRIVKIKNKDGIEEDIAVGGMIAITQPRRVAAMTLAQRVAREMDSPIEKGQPGKVGYAVRFDTNVPRGAKIKFLTEGMLLQEMLKDPHLRQYSAVIVDEIHERSVDVDLVAGFLRLLLNGDKKGRGGLPLKVVVMSATLDMGGLEAFFSKPEARPEHKPGRDHGKAIAPHLLQYYEEEDVDSSTVSDDTYSTWSGFSSDGEPSMIEVDGSSLDLKGAKAKPSSNNNLQLVTKSNKPPKATQGAGIHGTILPKVDDDDDDEATVDKAVSKNGVAVLYVTGRQYEVELIYETAPAPDYLDKMLRKICTLHMTEQLPGDILCFLTGQEEIETLKSQLESYALVLDKRFPRMKVMPLYGSLSAILQQEAFDKVKEKFTRKIVLATNIAETSVTVPGVKYVVDCGKAKVKQYRPRLGMESLLVKPISSTSAIQRQGRAGRESKGKCFRLYTEKDFTEMVEDEKPEILRSDVIEAVLKMKARGVNDILNFPLMDKPDVLAMEKALVQLFTMGAIDGNGKLTDAGNKMAQYPLPAAYGRVIVEAAKADCLLEVIDIVSCITSDAEVFMQAKSEEQQIEIDENRRLLQHPKGDILTYLNTMQKYAQENADRKGWCAKHMVSQRAMFMALNIRRQLRQVCSSQKLLSSMPPPDPQPYAELTPQKEDTLLKTFVSAFVTKTAVLGGDGSYLTTTGRNPINIHPSSVLHGKKLEAIMFLEHVFTTKSYAKKVSAIQANWIEGALMGI